MVAKRKIIVVDDNPLNLKLAGDVLEMRGFEVRRCPDARATLETLQTFRPAVILMDISLPGMDGIQLTQKIKEDSRNKDIKVIALTASAMKGDKEKILAAGLDGYIAKPIDTRKLVEQLSTYLQ